MSRYTGLIQAFDKLAEASAVLALELQALDSPSSEAAAPEAGERALPPAPAAPRRQAPDDSAFTECPAHRIPFKDGRYGKFCSGQSDDPNWANDKGYCRVTPRSAGAWLKQHPQGVAA